MGMESAQLENKKADFEKNMDNQISEILVRYPEVAQLGTVFDTEISALKTKILDIKKGSIERGNYIEVKYNKNTSKPYILDERATKTPITLGQIVAGLEWGKKFYLSHDSFNDSGASKIYSTFISKLIEHETLSLLNKYIVENESKKGDLNRARAYEGIKESSNRSVENLPLGAKAEKLIKAFLTRISIDKPELEFEVIQTNAYEDVALKIDFIIKIKEKFSGLKVESRDQIKKIQFTIESSEQKIYLKKEQAAKFNVTLIQMPDLEIGKAFSTWKRNMQYNTQGPDSYLETETEEAILREIVGVSEK